LYLVRTNNSKKTKAKALATSSLNYLPRSFLDSEKFFCEIRCLLKQSEEVALKGMVANDGRVTDLIRLSYVTFTFKATAMK